MRERCKESANDKRCGQRFAAALRGSLTVVKNVFAHREAQRRHGSVNNSIYDSVEFVLLPEEDEENNCLTDFLDNRCRDNCGEGFSRVCICKYADDALARGI